jgi:hypothetical protein
MWCRRSGGVAPSALGGTPPSLIRGGAWEAAACLDHRAMRAEGKNELGWKGPGMVGHIAGAASIAGLSTPRCSMVRGVYKKKLKISS